LELNGNQLSTLLEVITNMTALNSLYVSNKVIKLKNIPAILKTLGSHKDGITSEKICNSKPNKLAPDEKVIERYSKKEHIDTHNDTCQAGYFYC